MADEVSRQSETLKTYLVFYIFTQNMKGRRILNLMLTSILNLMLTNIFPGQCAFISYESNQQDATI